MATTTSTSSIDPALLPYLTKGLERSKELFLGSNQPQFFSGPTYVPPSAETTQALEMAKSRALAGNPLVGQAQGALSKLMGAQNPGQAMYGNLYDSAQRDPSQGFYSALNSGAFQNAATPATQQTASGAFLSGNPFFAGAFQPAARMAQQNFFDSMGQINSTASKAGRFGSNAMGELQNRAMDQYARSLNETAGNLAYGNYNAERQMQEAATSRLGSLSQQDIANRMSGAQALTQGAQQGFANQLAAAGGLSSTANADYSRQLSALSQAPGLASADYADISKLAGVGAAQEQIAMQPLQDSMARFNFQQQLPYSQLSGYLSSVYGTPLGSYGSSSTVMPQNTLVNGLAGAGAGYLGGQAINSFLTGNPFSLTSPSGYGLAGAGLGGLLGFGL